MLYLIIWRQRRFRMSEAMRIKQSPMHNLGHSHRSTERTMPAAPTACDVSPGWKLSQRLYERLASLGMMRIPLKLSLKHPNTIGLWCTGGFKGALNRAPIKPRDASFSENYTYDRCCFSSLVNRKPSANHGSLFEARPIVPGYEICHTIIGVHEIITEICLDCFGHEQDFIFMYNKYDSCLTKNNISCMKYTLPKKKTCLR